MLFVNFLHKLLTIKILRAYGYQTIGLDNDHSKVDIAQREGMAPVTDNIDDYFKTINDTLLLI